MPTLHDVSQRHWYPQQTSFGAQIAHQQGHPAHQQQTRTSELCDETKGKRLHNVHMRVNIYSPAPRLS